MKPVVALIGRPNVGKSTLFNRIVGTKQALVDDFPGVTRDRHYAQATWNDRVFTLIDTGGFLSSDDDYFAAQIREQLTMAVEEADAVVLILDGRSGISPYDRELVDFLRKESKPVFYAINKIESYKLENDLYEFYSLGLESFYKISSEHGIGVPDLLDDLVEILPERAEDSDGDEDEIKIAIVGRPNVGKSSLANKLFGENRLVVNERAGTTRDAISLSVEHKGKNCTLIDTAGIRRKGRVVKKLEKFSIIKSLKSLDECDVALILIDASEGVTDQDIHIAGYAEKRGCGAVFLFNKWDIVDPELKNEKKFIEQLRQKAKFLSYAPAMTISALTGQRCHKILDRVIQVYEEYCHRVSTGLLNRIVEDAVYREEPSLHKGRRIKFHYSTQVAAKPPCFVCFVNFPEGVHFSYKRYLINQLREMIPLSITPIKLLFKEKTGRIDFSKKTKKSQQYKEKKTRKLSKRYKERKEQSRRKKERDRDVS